MLFKRPDFQAPVVKNSKMRAEPDVSYNAAVTVSSLLASGGLRPAGASSSFGGTSAGSPQWAGLTAITDQLAGGRVGNINKTLYILGKKDQGKYFHDIRPVTTRCRTTARYPITGFTPGSASTRRRAGARRSRGRILPAIAKPGNG